MLGDRILKLTVSVYHHTCSLDLKTEDSFTPDAALRCCAALHVNSSMHVVNLC